MPQVPPPIQHPPTQRGPNRAKRQVGVELEFGSLPLDAAARLIQSLLGGKIDITHAFYQEVKGTSLGDFTLEVDSRLLTHKAYQKPLQQLGIDPNEVSLGDQSLAEVLEQVMGETASLGVPFEIGAPPIPYDQLAKLDELRRSLRDAGAEGTRESWVYAFGLHLNPEAPSHEAESVLAHVRAFLLLYPWLLRDGEVDRTRRVSHFIDPFPKDYLKLLFDANYTPDGPQLVRDYHQYNPDRNRPLDLYPLLAELWPNEVKELGDLGKLRPRPTYHYRLPNSDIDREDWSLIGEWNRWVKVETLAAQPRQMQTLMQTYLTMEADTLINFEQDWYQYLNQHYFSA